jgi:long-chain fatty acid transport protein
MELSMRRCKIAACGFLLVAGLWQSGKTSGFENTGVGAQAHALGGAFRAIADDWTAAYYNPAGYAFIKDNQIGGNSAFLQYREEITPNYRWGGMYETGVYNDRQNFNNHEILSNPSAGFVVRLPIAGETIFGLSAYQPYDYNSTWNLYETLDAYNDSLTTPQDQFRTNLDVVSFQLTAARSYLEDKLAVGLGFQILRADLIFNTLQFRQSPLWERDRTSILVSRPYDKITEWSHHDGNGWGMGLRGGLLYKLNEKTNVAVTFSLPSTVTVKGQALLNYYMPYNRTIRPPDSGSTGGTVLNLFTSGSRVIDSADFESKLTLPRTMAFGISWQATQKLRLSFDAEYVRWSVFDGWKFTYSNHRGLRGAADTAVDIRQFFQSNTNVPVSWESAGKVAIGLKYDIASRLSLLAGGTADQSPLSNGQMVSPNLIDTGDKYIYNFGGVLHVQRWDLSAMMSYTSFPDHTTSAIYDWDGDGTPDTFPGAYKASRIETVMSFTYRF